MGTVRQSLYQIRWRKSKDLLADFIIKYNTGKDLGEQLRASHKKLSEYLLFIYANAIHKEQVYGDDLKAGIPLPPLRMNNTQLAKEMGCSRRTIINLVKRLIEANLITDKVFHGSNAQYAVNLTPLILHIQTKQDASNLIHYFDTNFINAIAHSSEKSGASAPGFFSVGVQTLHHTVSSTCQGTKELNNLSGDNFGQGFDSKSKIEEVICPKPSTGHVRDTQVTQPNVKKAAASEAPDTGTSYETAIDKKSDLDKNSPPVALAPPESAPLSIEDVLRHLPANIAKKIRLHVQVIYTAAMVHLYPGGWMTESEECRAKAVISEYLAYSDANRMDAGASEILERIILAKRWIKRGHDAGLKRWVPLPSIYFDHRNTKYGFINTKPWYKLHMAKRKEFKEKELVTKAVQQYLRSFEPDSKYGKSETYRQISQRLGKRSKALVTDFQARIKAISNDAIKDTKKVDTRQRAI